MRSEQTSSAPLCTVFDTGNRAESPWIQTRTLIEAAHLACGEPETRMSSIAGWIAPIATAIAAVMTASNLGARVTGWGFAVFVVASVSWCVIGMTTGQPNLLWANGFLTLVNLVGVWRWLGRQARYERGGEKASLRSWRSRRQDLVPLGGLIGARVTDPRGEPLGQVTEVMLRCGLARPAYLVVSSGGVAGVGETLHALYEGEFSLTRRGVSTRITQAELDRREALDPDSWPV
jgi:hypothetical protein